MDDTFAILAQLEALNRAINQLNQRIDEQVADLREFSERFEDVIERLEEERRRTVWDEDGLDE